MMHAGVGTALGGVMTMVGEPQNLIIAEQAGWNFSEFFFRMAPVTVPVLICGLLTCLALEKFKLFGYGAHLPRRVWLVLAILDRSQSEKMTNNDRLKLIVQAIIAVWLIIGLAFHLAAVGLIGLTIIILATSFAALPMNIQLGAPFRNHYLLLLCW